MKILNCYGTDDLASVYIAEFGQGKVIEFVESLQPPIPRHEKWVLIVSTSFGCPVQCVMCDAGGDYKGKLSAEQILAQIDFLVSKRYPDQKVPAKKFKIQFARMGEPSLNLSVLEVLKRLPGRYDTSGLMPCISTIAPIGSKRFFEELMVIKNENYDGGKFQLQFSIHSTDEKERDRLVPFAKWSLTEIAYYGAKFYRAGDRKVTLNFALARGVQLSPQIMTNLFSPDYFMIKITPLNPTYAVVKSGLKTYISPYDYDKGYDVVDKLREYGYDTLISIGENEENLIGSNCGQYVTNYFKLKKDIPNSYDQKYLGFNNTIQVT